MSRYKDCPCPECLNAKYWPVSGGLKTWERDTHKLDELANILVGCAQLLDTIKGEWGESWSEWDQSIRDGISSQLKIIYAAQKRRK